MNQVREGNRGQTLLEIIFLIGVSLLILTGLVVTVVFSLKAVYLAKNKAIATRLAREKIEQLRLNKQKVEFWQNPDSWGCNQLESSEELGETNFNRQTICGEIEEIGDGKKKRLSVTVEVWWQGGLGSKVTLETVLTNWEE